MFLGGSVAHLPAPDKLDLLQKRVDAMRLHVRGLVEEIKQREASFMMVLKASEPELLLGVSNQFQYSALMLIYFIRIPRHLVVCSVTWCSTRLAIS
jgi:hypothetical protein